jgi:hypothetical protein
MHAYYIQATSEDHVAVTARRNILSRASWGGLMQRPAGVSTGNLFVQNGVSQTFGGHVSGGYPTAPAIVNQVTGNVVLQDMGFTGGTVAGSPGWGIVAYSTIQPVSVANNLVIHNLATSNWIGIGFGTSSADLGPTNSSITGNTVCDWPEQSTGFTNIIDWTTRTNGPSGNVISGNTQQLANCTGIGSSPTRTVDTYDTDVLGGPGTLAHFMSLAQQQSKDNWDTRLTACAVNTYIAAGLGVSWGC